MTKCFFENCNWNFTWERFQQSFLSEHADDKHWKETGKRAKSIFQLKTETKTERGIERETKTERETERET